MWHKPQHWSSSHLPKTITDFLDELTPEEASNLQGAGRLEAYDLSKCLVGVSKGLRWVARNRPIEDEKLRKVAAAFDELVEERSCEIAFDRDEHEFDAARERAEWAVTEAIVSYVLGTRVVEPSGVGHGFRGVTMAARDPLPVCHSARIF